MAEGLIEETFGIFLNKSNQAIARTIDLTTDAYTSATEIAVKTAGSTKETFGKLTSTRRKGSKGNAESN